jgi:hypothetical protein
MDAAFYRYAVSLLLVMGPVILLTQSRTISQSAAPRTHQFGNVAAARAVVVELLCILFCRGCWHFFHCQTLQVVGKFLDIPITFGRDFLSFLVKRYIRSVHLEIFDDGEVDEI